MEDYLEWEWESAKTSRSCDGKICLSKMSQSESTKLDMPSTLRILEDNSSKHAQTFVNICTVCLLLPHNARDTYYFFLYMIGFFCLQSRPSIDYPSINQRWA